MSWIQRWGEMAAKCWDGVVRDMPIPEQTKWQAMLDAGSRLMSSYDRAHPDSPLIPDKGCTCDKHPHQVCDVCQPRQGMVLDCDCSDGPHGTACSNRNVFKPRYVPAPPTTPRECMACRLRICSGPSVTRTVLRAAALRCACGNVKECASRRDTSHTS